ncbi:MAG: DMT family transporter [Alphaproteobacteria bacterium]|nr:DMT family transporter [Alphaproteobacteria bacterium]
MIRRLRDSPYLLLILATLFWAGNNIVARAAVAEMPPMALSFWRWATALVLVTPFAWPHVRAQAALIRRHWKILVLLGVLGVASFNTFLNVAVTTTTVVNVSLFNAVTPAFMILAAWMVTGERVNLRVVVGMALSFLGVAVIVAKGDIGTLLDLAVTEGDLLMIPAVLSWAFYTALLRYRPAALAPLALIFVTFLVGVVVVGLAYAVEIAMGRGFTPTLPTLAAIGYVGVFPSLLAYVFWNRGVQLLGAGVGGQFQYLTPIWGILGAIVLLGESVHAYHALGIAGIFLGVYLATRR